MSRTRLQTKQNVAEASNNLAKAERQCVGKCWGKSGEWMQVMEVCQMKSQAEERRQEK